MGGVLTRKKQDTKPKDATASAPGPVGLTLPEDGTWVTYKFDATELGKKKSGTCTFRMVGTTIEENQRCRKSVVKHD